jgi:hypothetical protein
MIHHLKAKQEDESCSLAGSGFMMDKVWFSVPTFLWHSLTPQETCTATKSAMTMSRTVVGSSWVSQGHSGPISRVLHQPFDHSLTTYLGRGITGTLLDLTPLHAAGHAASAAASGLESPDTSLFPLLAEKCNLMTANIVAFCT